MAIVYNVDQHTVLKKGVCQYVLLVLPAKSPLFPPDSELPRGGNKFPPKSRTLGIVGQGSLWSRREAAQKQPLRSSGSLAILLLLLYVYLRDRHCGTVFLTYEDLPKGVIRTAGHDDAGAPLQPGRDPHSRHCL